VRRGGGDEVERPPRNNASALVGLSLFYIFALEPFVAIELAEVVPAVCRPLAESLR
jgi:hypothetical protein